MTGFFRHETGRANIAKRVFTPLYEGDEAVALQDEMRSDLGRDDLNPGSHELLENFSHIL